MQKLLNLPALANNDENALVAGNRCHSPNPGTSHFSHQPAPSPESASSFASQLLSSNEQDPERHIAMERKQTPEIGLMEPADIRGRQGQERHFNGHLCGHHEAI
jgi:hypothetical protein